jgi:hypothetical protein
VDAGYRPGCQVPVTLLGFSGGGEISMGAAPLLKQAIDGPLDIISLAGVFCGHNDILKLEHIYHLVGDKDPVERSGPVLFPKRWKVMFLSYWNRAKQRGQISLISLGPVGHQTPGGVWILNMRLPDGRTHQQQTVDWVVGILEERLPPVRPSTPLPRAATVGSKRDSVQPPGSLSYSAVGGFRPLSPPGPVDGTTDFAPCHDERGHEDGVWFEVYHTDALHQPIWWGKRSG